MPGTPNTSAATVNQAFSDGLGPFGARAEHIGIAFN